MAEIVKIKKYINSHKDLGVYKRAESLAGRDPGNILENQTPQRPLNAPDTDRTRE